MELARGATAAALLIPLIPHQLHQGAGKHAVPTCKPRHKPRHKSHAALPMPFCSAPVRLPAGLVAKHTALPCPITKHTALPCAHRHIVVVQQIHPHPGVAG